MATGGATRGVGGEGDVAVEHTTSGWWRKWRGGGWVGKRRGGGRVEWRRERRVAHASSRAGKDLRRRERAWPTTLVWPATHERIHVRIHTNTHFTLITTHYTARSHFNSLLWHFHHSKYLLDGSGVHFIPAPSFCCFL